MSDRYGYIGIETLLNFCENSKDHAVTPNDFMRMKRVRVPEPKTGQWITNETIINCSKCKHCSWSRRSFEHVVRSFNFCPNCGADMRGEQDDD